VEETLGPLTVEIEVNGNSISISISISNYGAVGQDVSLEEATNETIDRSVERARAWAPRQQRGCAGEAQLIRTLDD
jgi:hypothetical protein